VISAWAEARKKEAPAGKAYQGGIIPVAVSERKIIANWDY
jgi:hypothetical protein